MEYIYRTHAAHTCIIYPAGTHPMNIILTLLTLLLVVSTTIHAQPLVQDTIPQLKEWWRADDKMYGKDGMTWLDNFYHGKGVLVVSTPSGVQSWQLRFPGDTTNVFTWSGGSAAIQSGDFNGDGINDYVDGQGNIYVGVQQGEPPKSVPSGKGFFPSLISDINGDGYADLLASGAVIFGQSDISKIETKSLMFPELDSNNRAIAAYITSPGEMRIVCRRNFWTNLTEFPYRRVYKEGLRLVRIWWEGNGFKSEKLDEFTVPTLDSTGIFWQKALISHPSGKHYFLCATMIKGTNVNTDLSVYDVTNDKLDKKYSTVVNRLGRIGSFQHSVDNDSLPDWYIVYFQSNGYCDVGVFSSTVENSVQSLGKYNVCASTAGLSLPLADGDKPEHGIVVTGYHELYAFPVSCFRIVRLPNSVGGISEPDELKFPLRIESITPQPVSPKQNIQIRVSSPIHTDYEISLFSTTGNKLFELRSGYSTMESQTLTIPLPKYNLSQGVYWLALTVGKETTHTKLIID